MYTKPTIRLRLAQPHLLTRKGLAYQIVAKVLTEMGGTEQYIERRALINGVSAELDRLGLFIANLDSTLSTFCTLPGVDAVFEHPGGHTEPFRSRRKQLMQKTSGPACKAEPDSSSVVVEEPSTQGTYADASAP